MTTLINLIRSRQTPLQQIKEPGFLNTILSVLAAAFGVQSRTNQHRDFSQGRLSYFILAGLLFTALFIVIVFSVAKLAKEQLENNKPQAVEKAPISSPKIPQSSAKPLTDSTLEPLFSQGVIGSLTKQPISPLPSSLS